MFPLDLLSEPVLQPLTWTLIHFLWQGLAVALAAAMLLSIFPIRRAEHRYLIRLFALIAMAACPIVTFSLAQTPEAVVAPIATASEVATPLVPETEPPFAASVIPSSPGEAVSLKSAPRLELSEAESAELPAPAAATWKERLQRYIDAIQPYALIAWVGGVLLLAVRLSMSWLHVRWLAWGCRMIPADLAAKAATLGKRLGLRYPARVRVSDKIRVAVVVGLWRPLVLLPAAWLTGTTPEVLEAVIAHELAHIRRFDLWVNLLQRMVETFLFYHPAVWWLSHRVSAEREMCTDELAVAATSERLAYATALEQLGRMRLRQTTPLLGAGIGENRMVLLSRVGNILGLSPSKKQARWWPVALAALALPMAIWLASTSVASAADKKTKPVPTAQDEATPAKEKAVADFTGTTVDRRAYSEKGLTFKGIKAGDKGKVEITFTATLESLYFCPGANAKITEKGIELTFVRAYMNKRPKVTYPVKRVRKGNQSVKVITVAANGKPIFLRYGRNLVKLFPKGKTVTTTHPTTQPTTQPGEAAGDTLDKDVAENVANWLKDFRSDDAAVRLKAIRKARNWIVDGTHPARALYNDDLARRRHAAAKLDAGGRQEIIALLLDRLEKNITKRTGYKHGWAVTKGLAPMVATYRVASENEALASALKELGAKRAVPLMKRAHTFLRKLPADEKGAATFSTFAECIYMLSMERVDVFRDGVMKPYEPGPILEEQALQFLRPDLTPTGGLTASLEATSLAKYPQFFCGDATLVLSLTVTNHSDQPVPIDLSPETIMFSSIDKHGKRVTIPATKMSTPAPGAMPIILAPKATTTYTWRIEPLKNSPIGRLMNSNQSYKFLKAIYTPASKLARTHRGQAGPLVSNTLNRYYFDHDTDKKPDRVLPLLAPTTAPATQPVTKPAKKTADDGV